MGDAEMKRMQLIKRLRDQGYNLQVMAANQIKEWLASERHADELERLERERQQKEKDRILRRIMDSNLRFAGIAFRQAFIFMEAEREKERVLANKQRGVMMRILDSNTRLMGMGYNKLIEESKARKEYLKNKLRFVIKALTDADAGFILAGYNAMKQYTSMINNLGLENNLSKKLKLRLIRKLTDSSYN
jgi:hypothetical protein